MDEVRQNISSLTLKLESQINLPLWSLANQNVVFSVATGRKPTWGPKTRFLTYLVRIAYKISISDFVLLLLGMLSAISLWWKIFTRNKFNFEKPNKYKKVFAGFGAASEEYIYSDYLAESKDATLRINWVTLEGLNKLGPPNLLYILRTITKNSFGHTKKIRSAIPEVASHAIDFLTVSALNIGPYAFYRSYWRKAREHGVGEVAFLAPDMQALACVDENLKTIFLQHGLLSMSILLPKFNQINVLTSHEEIYLKKIRKIINVQRKSRVINTDEYKNDILMIVPPATLNENNFIKLETAIQWAKDIGLQIIIRPAPTTEGEMINAYIKRFTNFLFDDLTISLETSYEKWKPKLIASWWSTGLATALDYGSLPVSFCDPGLNYPFCDIIYPMKYRVLFWPRDEMLLRNAIRSEEIYQSQLMNLQRNQDDSLLISLNLMGNEHLAL